MDAFKGVQVTVLKGEKNKKKKDKKESKKKKKSDDEEEEEKEEVSEDEKPPSDFLIEVKYYSSDFNEKLFIQQLALAFVEKCFKKAEDF